MYDGQSDRVAGGSREGRSGVAGRKPGVQKEREVREASSPGATATPRIGPNAVIRLLERVTAADGPLRAAALARAAGVPEALPPGMIPEAWFRALTAEVRRAYSPSESDRLLKEAGVATADYVRAHRIPAPIRILLRTLPRRIALPVLLRAFARHAWTFAGSAAFRVERGPPLVLRLSGAPTCHGCHTERVLGSFYEGAFETLLTSLIDARLRVRETHCVACGDTECAFLVWLDDDRADLHVR